MRRQEKEIKNRAAIDQVLEAGEWGVLGLVSPEGKALLVPLNYVYFEGRIYFHGAHDGEKMDAIRANGEATFLVVEAYAQIPSYAFDPERACKATQFYRSVMAYGRVGLVEDLDRKARVLQATMERLQPEGGYRAIAASDPLYAAAVKEVAILELTVARVSGKQEVGQRLTPSARASATESLLKRGGPGDLRAAAALGGPGSPAPSGEGPEAAPAS